MIIIYGVIFLIFHLISVQIFKNLICKILDEIQIPYKEPRIKRICENIIIFLTLFCACLYALISSAYHQ